MLRIEFKAVIEAINNEMGDEGYFIWVTTKSGTKMEGSWSWLSRDAATHEVVVIDDNNNPALYVPLSQIESIQRSTR